MTETRRNQVLAQLKISEKPISATTLARQFGVSRQVIVGDIALLRASGEKIVATNNGYIYNPYQNGKNYIIAMNHKESQTREELMLFVEYGAIVINVMVEHPVYGELVGNLNIKTHDDIERFLSSDVPLLSSLTQGIHLHTIQCDNDEHFSKIHEVLRKYNLTLD